MNELASRSAENVGEVEALLSGRLDADQFRPRASRTVLVGLVVVAVVIASAVAVAWGGIRAKEEEVLTGTERRLGILAAGRVEVMDTWLAGVLSLADRVVQADMFRLFAAEVDLGAAPAGDEPSVQEQTPLMAAILAEFVQNTGFLAGHMIARDGTGYVTTAPVYAADPRQAGLVEAAFAGGRPVVGPLRPAAEGLVLDLFLPLRAPQEEGRVVGVLHLSRAVTDRLAEFLAPSPLALPGEAFRLVQPAAAGDGVELLAPGAVPPVRPLAWPGAAVDGLNFDARTALDGAGRVYSLALPVPRLGWTLVAETDWSTARAEVAAFTRAAGGIAGLIALVVCAAFGAFWWRMVGDHNRSLAEQFRALAARIHSQRQLLDNINNSIADWIGLKSRDGTYIYVNPALALAVQRPLERVAGLDDAALFGHDTAARLRVSDEQVVATGHVVTVDERIYLGAKLHYLQISKMPLRDGEGAILGIVSVWRDVTELVIQQQKREKAVKQMVLALVRAIELRDPYLAGHSRRIAAFSSAIARRLGLPVDRQSTVEIAANLSQIGKLSISRALLNKPERLTPEEQREIQGHVEHAAAVLRDIDFELPVFEALYQMNERLDGGGYPHGLAGEQISVEGRILAVCDVFCARIAPRAYRGAIGPEEALAILKQNDGRYDPQVVAMLEAVLQSGDGERMLHELGIVAATDQDVPPQWTDSTS